MSEPISITEYARRIAAARMAADPTVAGLTASLKELHQVADTGWQRVQQGAAKEGLRLACREGCDFCCHEPVPVSVLEATVLAGYVEGHFTTEQREELGKRGERYRLERKRGAPSTPCPFLLKGRCSVYEERPLACRGAHSLDLGVCKARLGKAKPLRPGARSFSEECLGLMEGFSQATPGRLYPEPIELGLLAERIAQGASADAHVMGALQYKEKPESDPNEPAGITLFTPEEVRPYLRLRNDQDIEGAMASIADLSETRRRLLNFVAPLIYTSVEDAEHWWAHGEAAMAALEELDVDPSEAFNGLAHHSTMPYGYTDKDLRDLFARFGQWVHDRVITPLFPDLVAPIEKPRRPGPIRVGYASMELANRNGAQWSIGWLEAHGSEFETYAINLGHRVDRVTERFIRSADHYISLPGHVPSSARAIRDLDLDFLIFPGVGDSGRSVQFASMRLARAQATGWGYPATSGLPNMDYYLSGEFMHPAGGEGEFTEQLIRMPQTGLILDDPYRPFGPDAIPPLPPGYLLMGHNLAKLHPKYDWVWAEISRRSGKPIVMVVHPSERLTEIAKQRLAKAGADVHWLPYMSQNQFEKIMAGATMSLDPQVWTGGYTTFQAMKLGIPVVTMVGKSMRTHLSVAFMRQAGGDDLIASTPEEFVEIACDLDRVNQTRRKIRKADVFGDHGVGRALNAFIQSTL